MTTIDSPEPDPLLVDSIRERLVETRQRIERAGGGRDVLIVAVTKMFPNEVARAAVASGLRDLGENYAQDLASKAAALNDLDIRWHFIGGLQRNKIKRYGSAVSLWQTMDRIELLDELAKRFPGAEVLIQVNTTGEGQKSGCAPDDAPRLVANGQELGLDVRGLMTVGPTESSVDPVPSFARLRELGESLGLPELSMGMSGDFERAIAEGATMVRIGAALFGPRPSML